MPFTIKRKDKNSEISSTEAYEKAEFALARDNTSLDMAEAIEADAQIEGVTDEIQEEFTENTSFKDVFLEGFLFKNPSLVDFVGLTPIIVGGTSVKNGLVLSLATVIVLVAVCMFASLTKNILPKKIAPAVYTIVAAVLLIPLTWLGYTVFPSTMFSLGLIFPLIAVNGINLSRAYGFASKNNIMNSLADALGKGLGFSSVLIVISAIREIFGYGTFFDITIPIFSEFHSSIICGVPGGFAAMAAFAAIVQLMSQKNGTKSQM